MGRLDKIKEIASSLGKLVEVDWQNFFSSFFSTIRIKIICKDPTKIPLKRVLEMDNQLYLVTFKVEGVVQTNDKPEDGDPGGEDKDKDKDDKGNEEDETMDDDDLLGDDLLGEPSLDHGGDPRNGQLGKNAAGTSKSDSKQKTFVAGYSSSQGQLIWEESELAIDNAPGVHDCINLLQAMEMELSEGEEGDNQGAGDDDASKLPKEWTYPMNSDTQ